MNSIERFQMNKEYQNVLNTLVNYHLSKGKKYSHIFCDHPEKINPTSEIEEALKEGTIDFKESASYVKKDKENLRKWRVKELDMTAVIDTNCEIIIEVYRNSRELGDAKGNNVSVELENQSILGDENSILKYLSRNLSLSEKANIETIKKDNEWLIEDGKIYFVKFNEDRLSIYEKRNLNIIPHCKYMGVSKVGGEKYKWFWLIDPCFFILNSESPSQNFLSPKTYNVGKWKVIECYTKEFELELRKLDQ